MAEEWTRMFRTTNRLQSKRRELGDYYYSRLVTDTSCKCQISIYIIKELPRLQLLHVSDKSCRELRHLQY